MASWRQVHWTELRTVADPRRVNTKKVEVLRIKARIDRGLTRVSPYFFRQGFVTGRFLDSHLYWRAPWEVLVCNLYCSSFERPWISIYDEVNVWGSSGPCVRTPNIIIVASWLIKMLLISKYLFQLVVTEIISSDYTTRDRFIYHINILHGGDIRIIHLPIDIQQYYLFHSQWNLF